MCGLLVTRVHRAIHERKFVSMDTNLDAQRPARSPRDCGAAPSSLMRTHAYAHAPVSPALDTNTCETPGLHRGLHKQGAVLPDSRGALRSTSSYSVYTLHRHTGSSTFPTQKCDPHPAAVPSRCAQVQQRAARPYMCPVAHTQHLAQHTYSHVSLVSTCASLAHFPHKHTDTHTARAALHGSYIRRVAMYSQHVLLLLLKQIAPQHGGDLGHLVTKSRRVPATVARER